MNIALRFDSGIGDHLLSNRFAYAIKDKYPDSKLFMYSDENGDASKAELMGKLFPIYEKIEVMPKRNMDFKIKTQFGEENYHLHADNVAQEYKDKFAAADKYYNLCLDNMEWLDHDYDWRRYYNWFPKPNAITPSKAYTLPEQFIMVHLYPRPNCVYSVEQWYAVQLIKKLATVLPVVVITMDQHKSWYKEVEGIFNVHVLTPNMLDVFYIASKCTMFFGVDSSVRYSPLHYGKPTYVFSNQSSAPQQALPLHQIRWLLSNVNVFPLNYNSGDVVRIAKQTLEFPATSLFPMISGNLDQILLRRRKI